jgi:hypothetical protein
VGTRNLPLREFFKRMHVPNAANSRRDAMRLAALKGQAEQMYELVPDAKRPAPAAPPCGRDLDVEHGASECRVLAAARMRKYRARKTDEAFECDGVAAAITRMVMVAEDEVDELRALLRRARPERFLERNFPLVSAHLSEKCFVCVQCDALRTARHEPDRDVCVKCRRRRDAPLE